MKVSIHQPHYFPWLGYLDKMAKSDLFILLDEVQLTDKSNMFRNKFLTKDGKEKYLTVCFEKKDYMDKEFCQVQLNKAVNWQKNHINFLEDNYRKAPYFNEIFEKIKIVYEKDYDYLCEVAIDSVLILKKMFDIPTEIMLQSKIDYEKDKKKNDLVLELCKKNNASLYLSGNGAKKYMDDQSFENEGIKVIYQDFKYPVYSQIESKSFVPNLSAVDILFYCGVDKAREIFWDNVKKGNEFKGEDL